MPVFLLGLEPAVCCSPVYRDCGTGKSGLLIPSILLPRILLGFAVLLVAPSPSPAHADGDPLEEYDFSGKVPTADYAQKCRTRIYRHGLWTIQRHVTLPR